MKPPKRPAIAIAFRSSANGFDGEILQGPDTLHGRDALVAGLHLAVGLERNAKTEVELREAFRVWLASVMAWMRFQNSPAEFYRCRRSSTAFSKIWNAAASLRR